MAKHTKAAPTSIPTRAPANATAYLGEFKGQTILHLVNAADPTKEFAFGKRKAGLLISNIELVMKFALGEDIGSFQRAYKGKPILAIPDGTQYGFSFGREKAELVFENQEAVARFAAGQALDLPTDKPEPELPELTSAIVADPAALAAWVFGVTKMGITCDRILDAVNAVVPVELKAAS